MKPTMRYPEAIGLALAIAVALGGWASITVFERAADPEKVCAQQLKLDSLDESLWNLHCAQVAANRALQRPTELAGHGRTVPARTHSAGAIGHGSEGRGSDGSHCATHPLPPHT
jgi:hypothetical protein